MMQDALQQRIHDGDRGAFREFYGRYSREVYALALAALGSAAQARAVVKQVFLRLYRELMHSSADLDLPARLSALTNEEVRIVRIAMGDLSPEALQVESTLTVDPVADPLTRVRLRMAQQGREASGAEAASPAACNAAAGSAFAAEAARAAQKTAALSDEDAEDAPAPVRPAAPFSGENADAEDGRAPAAGDILGDAFEEAVAEDPAPLPAESCDAAADSAASAPSAEPVAKRRPRKKKKTRGLSGGAVFLIVFLSLLLLVFVWLLLGILMDLSVIGFADLGYSWFNANVFQFFQRAGGGV